MNLPDELQLVIESLVQHSPDLGKARELLTQDYKQGRISPFGEEAKRLAYLGARMPATYAAVHKVLQNLPSCESFLDLGAGPGTASWAAADLFPSLKQVTLIEKSPDAIALGQRLAQSSPHPALREARWMRQMVSDPLPRANLAVFSYVLNELDDPEAVVERCWQVADAIAIIEPGTPKGFHLIRKIRQRLIDLQAHIIAPCPHSFGCPVQGSDWCHFSARVQRTRLHRLLKEGSLGYEDEKFSYLIASKISGEEGVNRVVRHPIKQSGCVRLTLCTNSGKLEERVVSRKEKERYREARDAEWGMVFKIGEPQR